MTSITIDANNNLIYNTDKKETYIDILKWYKLNPTGYQPSAREGHTSVELGNHVYIFGGFEGGMRSNTLIRLDILSGQWLYLKPSSSEIPIARSSHTACICKGLMLIYGGEGYDIHHKDNREKVKQGSILFNNNSMNNQFITTFQSIPTLKQHHSIHYQSSDNNSIDSITKDHPSPPSHILLSPNPSAAVADDTMLEQSNSSIITSEPPPLGKLVTVTHKPWFHSIKSYHNDDDDYSCDLSMFTNRPLNYKARSVTLGDDLYGFKFSHKVNKVKTDTPPIHCLNDLFIYDPIVNQWYGINSILTPLPRKGHTMNCITVNQIEYVLIFGGYNTDSLLASNILHICETQRIEDYIRKKQLRRQAEINTEVMQLRRKSFLLSSFNFSSTYVQKVRGLTKGYHNEPIVWGTLATKGSLPPPRYYHTTTIINLQTIVVYGGIGPTSLFPLNDLYILDLDTLCWSMLYNGTNSTTIPNHISSIIQQSSSSYYNVMNHDPTNVPVDIQPKQGIYGHVAFPIYNQEKTQLELLIFGGSYDINDISAATNTDMFVFNMLTRTWKTIYTNKCYQLNRYNFSASLVQYTWNGHNSTSDDLTHEIVTCQKILPPTKPISSLHTKPNPNLMFNSNSNNNNNQLGDNIYQKSIYALIIFGGKDNTSRCSDMFALDLNYKTINTIQYETILLNTEINPTLIMNPSILKLNKSLLDYEQTTINTLNNNQILYMNHNSMQDPFINTNYITPLCNELKTQSIYTKKYKELAKNIKISSNKSRKI